MLSVILFLVKIVFAFLLIIVVSIYFYKNYRNHSEAILALTAGLMIAIYPIAFIYQPLPLYMGLIEEAGYMVNDPLVKKVNLDKILVKCGGGEVVVSDPSIISRIRLHNMDITAPLTPEYSNQIGCSKKENGDIQRNLIRQLFFDDLYHGASKVIDKFLGAIFIRPELDHVHQMLIDKSELVKKYLNPLMYYEGGQVKFFREWWGLEPSIPPGVQLIEIAPVIDTIIKKYFRI